MQQKNYLPVNWIDGMKINKSHFIAQENALVYQLVQNTSCLLNELNYGILPAGTDGTGLKIFISTDNQKKLQVRIQQCRAITVGGYFIEFNQDTTLHGSLIPPVVSAPSTLRELKNRGTEFYIVLTIDPYKKIPFGVMETPEVPPRVPYTIPSLFVDLVPVAQVAKKCFRSFPVTRGKTHHRRSARNVGRGLYTTMHLNQ